MHGVSEGLAESSATPDFATRQLISGRALARNTAWSLVGLAVPLPIALVTLPLLTSRLGPDRFGILALILALIGYTSVLDFGLGRVLTKVIAEKLSKDEAREVPQIVWTALFLLAGLGLVGALLVGLISPWLVSEVLRIPQSLREESIHALTLLAVSLPFVVTSAGLRGVLEAQHKFGVVSAVNVAMGSFLLVGPVFVLPFSRSLVMMVAVIFVGRLAAWLGYLLLCLRVTPGLRQAITVQPGTLGPMLRLGGWLTISNVISPFLTYFDRFIVGSLVSIGAVAFYTVPYDLVARVSVVSSALGTVLFPAFAASYWHERDRTAEIFGWGARTLILLVAPITLICVSFAKEGLTVWLGSDYASNSTIVLQWLAVGIFINSMAQMPFALIQAIGRPDFTAKLHLCELLPYMAVLFWLVDAHGIVGAAMAWTARVTVDTLILLWFAREILPQSRLALRQMAMAVCLSLLLAVVGTQIQDLPLRFALILTATIVLVPAMWFFLLSLEERTVLIRFLRPDRSRESLS